MAGAEHSHSSLGLALATTTGFIVAAVIIFLILFIFVFLLCLRLNRCWGATSAATGGNHVRPAPAPATAATAHRPGLDSAALKAIPRTVFRSEDLKDGAECCAVCLSELSAGEAARRLPNCNHAFHLECIDMWFFSHATCPLCRRRLDPPKQPGLAEEPSPDSPVCVLLSALRVQAGANADTGSQEGSPSSAGASSGEIAVRPRDSPSMSRSRRTVGAPPAGDVEQGCLQPSRLQTTIDFSPS